MKIVIPGYEHIRMGRTRALVATGFGNVIRDVLESRTLYEYAEATTEVQPLRGRAPVHVTVLPGGPMVAVRHVMRGGLLGRFVKDSFLPPTRALRELFNAARLALAGVPTPQVIAVVTYASGLVLRTSDVATRYIADGADLAAVLGDARNDGQRRPLLDAVGTLLARLAHAGAQHPDLNLRNILITSGHEGYLAHVLDVDRVRFNPGDEPLVARANLDRLEQSLRKWGASAGVGRALANDDARYLRERSSALA